MPGKLILTTVIGAIALQSCCAAALVPTTCDVYAASAGIACVGGLLKRACVEGGSGADACSIDTCCGSTPATSSCYAYIRTAGKSCPRGYLTGFCTYTAGQIDSCSEQYCCLPVIANAAMVPSDASCYHHYPYIYATERNFDWRCDCFMSSQKMTCEPGKKLLASSKCSRLHSKAPDVPQCLLANCCA